MKHQQLDSRAHLGDGDSAQAELFDRRAQVQPSDLRDDAPALNGTKPRPVRDPRFTKRRRKPLTR